MSSDKNKKVRGILGKMFGKAKDAYADKVNSAIGGVMHWNNENKERVRQMGKVMPKKYPNLIFGSDKWKKAYNKESSAIKDARDYKKYDKEQKKKEGKKSILKKAVKKAVPVAAPKSSGYMSGGRHLDKRKIRKSALSKYIK